MGNFINFQIGEYLKKMLGLPVNYFSDNFIFHFLDQKKGGKNLEKMCYFLFPVFSHGNWTIFSYFLRIFFFACQVFQFTKLKTIKNKNPKNPKNPENS
jgi:hypothetical protein